MEKELLVGLLLAIGIAIAVALRAWLFWGSPYAPGEELKDSMVRQYGSHKAWLVLFLITLVCSVLGIGFFYVR